MTKKTKDTTDKVPLPSGRGWVWVHNQYQHLSDTIARLPRLMDEGQGDVVYDSRNRVARFVVDGLTLMVKRYKRVNAIQQVVYTFFRKTKAERAYRFALEFLQRGIDTPQPVAYIEERHHGLFTTGYFVSLEVAGTETSLLLREVKDYPANLAEAVARQVVFMHSRGVLHGDLNLSNFLCQTNEQSAGNEKQEDAYHFCMIDTNRSHFVNCPAAQEGQSKTEGWETFPSDRECMQNMVRLTHRRDLYEDLIRRYARLRGWDADVTSAQALQIGRASCRERVSVAV